MAEAQTLQYEALSPLQALLRSAVPPVLTNARAAAATKSQSFLQPFASCPVSHSHWPAAWSVKLCLQRQGRRSNYGSLICTQQPSTQLYQVISVSLFASLTSVAGICGLALCMVSCLAMLAVLIWLEVHTKFSCVDLGSVASHRHFQGIKVGSAAPCFCGALLDEA